MAYFNHLSFLLTVSVFLLETGFVKLAEIGSPINRASRYNSNLEIAESLDDEPEVPWKTKKLDIFKTENRKAPKNKELVTKSNTTVAPIKDNLETALYRLRSDEGRTCILLQVDAIVSFKYMTKLDEQQESDNFVPTTATVKGDCSGDDKQTLLITWKSFVLIWYFAKSPGGDRWFVPKINLKFDSTDPFFEHIKNPGRSYTLSSITSHSSLLFPTPVGKAYKCDREIEVELSSSETRTVATLYLRDFRLEPFIFKNDEFGQDYMCAATGSGNYRSETAPFVVGCMLAAACLLTIAGYAIYRYFNIEKVQYDTME